MGVSREGLAVFCNGDESGLDQIHFQQVSRRDGSLKRTVRSRPRLLIYPLGDATGACDLVSSTPLASGKAQLNETDNDVTVTFNRTNSFGCAPDGQRRRRGWAVQGARPVPNHHPPERRVPGPRSAVRDHAVSQLIVGRTTMRHALGTCTDHCFSSALREASARGRTAPARSEARVIGENGRGEEISTTGADWHFFWPTAGADVLECADRTRDSRVARVPRRWMSAPGTSRIAPSADLRRRGGRALAPLRHRPPLSCSTAISRTTAESRAPGGRTPGETDIGDVHRCQLGVPDLFGAAFGGVCKKMTQSTPPAC